MKQGILYIEGTQNLINKAIENKLAEAGFEVSSMESDIDEINRRRHDADIVLYYLENDDAKTAFIMRYLVDLCMSARKSLCLIGEHSVISQLREEWSSVCIARCYTRPLDMSVIVSDMQVLVEAHDEFRRKKSILIVDDDEDFLTIMGNWLKNAYTVFGVHSGVEAMDYITVSRPDLILLDYEMPELDGYEVMEKLHKNPLTSRIPIIFLTGINDRESVMRIIKHKPEGYILKSTKKSELLDTLDQFFADRIFGGLMKQA